MATKKYRGSVSQTCIYNLIYWPRSCFYKSVAFIPRLKSWAFSLTFRNRELRMQKKEGTEPNIRTAPSTH